MSTPDEANATSEASTTSEAGVIDATEADTPAEVGAASEASTTSEASEASKAGATDETSNASEANTPAEASAARKATTVDETSESDAVREVSGPGNRRAAVGLERDYRLLLLAYPRDYRERRFDEMLATLLDDAAPGQLRPTWGETADLLLGGARQRLRLPKLPGVWVAAVLSALIFGAVAAAGAAAVGWTFSGTLPDNQLATHLVTTAFTPRSGTVTTRRYDGVFGYQAPAGPTDRLFRVVLGDDTYTAGYVQVTGYPGEEHSLDEAAEALRRSGWHVDPFREEPDGSTLTASTARLTLQARLRSTDNRLVVVIHRSPPRTVIPLMVFGWLTGATAGWLFAGVLARRAGQQHPVVRFLMQAAVIAGLMSAMPATVLTTQALADAVMEPWSSLESPLWGAYMYPILRPLALSGMVFAIVAAGLATLASPGQPATRTAQVEVGAR